MDTPAGTWVAEAGWVRVRSGPVPKGGGDNSREDAAQASRLGPQSADPVGQRGATSEGPCSGSSQHALHLCVRDTRLHSGLPLLGGDVGWQALGWGPAGLTLKSWTPMQANMNCRRVVTRTMFPMVRMATNTHCTTCCGGGSPGWHLPLLAVQPSPGAPGASLAAS